MTDKLVVIINSLKVPKIKKILLYDTKFLVPNYSCLQNPWTRGLLPPPPDPRSLCSQLNLLNPPPPNKTPGCATGSKGPILEVYDDDDDDDGTLRGGEGGRGRWNMQWCNPWHFTRLWPCVLYFLHTTFTVHMQK